MSTSYPRHYEIPSVKFQTASMVKLINLPRIKIRRTEQTEIQKPKHQNHFFYINVDNSRICHAAEACKQMGISRDLPQFTKSNAINSGWFYYLNFTYSNLSLGKNSYKLYLRGIVRSSYSQLYVEEILGKI